MANLSWPRVDKIKNEYCDISGFDDYEKKVIQNLLDMINKIQERAVKEIDNRMKQKNPEKQLKTCKRWVKHWEKNELYKPIEKKTLNIFANFAPLSDLTYIPSKFHTKLSNERVEPEMQKWRILWEESKQKEPNQPNPLTNEKWEPVEVKSFSELSDKQITSLTQNKPINIFEVEDQKKGSSWNGMGLYKVGDTASLKKELRIESKIEKIKKEKENYKLKLEKLLVEPVVKTGVIWFFNQGAGYGFIKVLEKKDENDDESKDEFNLELPFSDAEIENDDLVYFHCSDIDKNFRDPKQRAVNLRLVAGEKVEFHVLETSFLGRASKIFKSKYIALKIKPIENLFFEEKPVRFNNEMEKLELKTEKLSLKIKEEKPDTDLFYLFNGINK